MKKHKPLIQTACLFFFLTVVFIQTSVLASWQVKHEAEQAKSKTNAKERRAKLGEVVISYIDCSDEKAQLQFEVYVPRDDIYEAVFRYSCSQAGTLAVNVNDDTEFEMSLPATGDLNSNWLDKTVKVSLKAGPNVMTLKTNGKSSVHLDNLIIRSRPQAVLDLAKRTLEFVEKQGPRPEFAAKLFRLEKKFSTAKSMDELDEIISQISSLRREIILSHPLLDFDRLLINKVPPPGYSHQCDQYLGRHSKAGPGLVVLENWKDNPSEKVLLYGKLPIGSVRHPDLSFDAESVLFAYSDHSQKDQSNRRFFIYEIGIDGSGLRQLTGTDDDPMARLNDRITVLVEDFDPCYLPDGGFAFISTRCQSFGRCHGSRYTPAYVLYRADRDGTNIRQISFGEANEWEPSVMNDGRLVYTRWDYINRHDWYFQSLWTMRPDGSATAHFYGNYTRNPCMSSDTMAIPGSHKVVAVAMAHHSYTSGSIIIVDPLKGQDGPDPIERVTPEICFPETEDWPVGCFSTPYPLSEDLFLAAYCPDKLTRQGSVQRENAYAIYLIDTLGGRELIYRDPDVSSFSPIPIVPRVKPAVIQSLVTDKPQAKTGTFFVQNVYESTQPIEPGTVKALRINEIISQPTRRKPALSRANNEIIKRIVGTVPVNPDGSAAFEAPADVPLQLQLLDENGMATMTMRTAVYLQKGESTSCVGCHEQREGSPLPRARRNNMTIHKPTPSAGPRYEGGFSYCRTVQPVLDRYCIDCHGLGKATKKLDLLGTMDGDYTISHNALTKADGMVKIAYRNLETPFSTPKEYYAHAGKLAKMLLDGHKGRVKLDRESFQRIVDWLDLNAQFYGDYSFNRKEHSQISPEGEKALREHIKEVFVDKLTDQPLAALINVTMPEQSRIILAPLSTQAGGWGKIKQNEWVSKNDPGYKKMLELVHETIIPMNTQDYAGTCNQTPCICGCCWVREAELLASTLKK